MGLFDSLKKKVAKVFNLSSDNESEGNSKKATAKEENVKAVQSENSKTNMNKKVITELPENDLLELSKKSFYELNELYDKIYSTGISNLSYANEELTKILVASLMKRGIKQDEATELLKDNDYFYFNPFKFKCDDPIFDFLEYFNKYNETILPIVNNPGCYYLLLTLFAKKEISRQELTFRCKNIEAPWILLNEYFWDDEEYYKDNWFGWITQYWLYTGELKNHADDFDNKILLLVLFGSKFFADNEFLFKKPKFVNPSQKHEIIKDLVENVLTIDNISSLDEQDQEYEYVVNQIRRYNFYTKWGEFYEEMEPIINFIYVYYNYEKYSYLDNSISKDDIENLIDEKLIALRDGYSHFIDGLKREDEMGFHLNKNKLQSTRVIGYNNDCLVGNKVREY